MRVYIAGPMNGYPDFNKGSFLKAWNILMAAGYDATSPHFLENKIEVEVRARRGVDAIYRYALPIDIYAISGVDAVVALPGWERSRGAGFEKHAADLMGIPWVAPEYTSDEYPMTEGVTDEDMLEFWINDCIAILEDLHVPCPCHR
jgi:hypothetical protein